MSNKKARHRQKLNEKQQAPSTRRYNHKTLVVTGLILCLGLTSLILAGWRGIHNSINAIVPLPTPTPSLSASNPSKEYIYAGGKLIATEEPSGGGTSPLSAPSSMTAKGDSYPGAKVTIQWNASTGGTVWKYQVERCQTFGPNCYSWVADVSYDSSLTTYTYIDSGTGVSANSAYLYRVRAVDSSGNYSNYSAPDLATAITFTDDPLNPSGTKTIIKADHLNELRRAVNGVRALVNLSPATWTYPDPVSSPASQRRMIYWEDVTDLRAKLDEALTILGLTQTYPSDPPLARGAVVYAAHFTQIRDRVK